MKLVNIVALSCIVALSGCESTPQENNSLPTGSKYASTKFSPKAVTARVEFSAQCKFKTDKQGISEFLGLFVPAAIEQAVDSLVGAVQKAGEDKTKSLSAYTDKHFYRVKTGLDGYDSNPATSCMALFIPNNDPNATTFSNQYALYSAEFGAYSLTAEPAFFMEMFVEKSADGKMFRLHPIFLLKTKHLHGSNSGNVKDMVIALDFRKPSGTGDSDTFATSLIELSDLQLGTIYDSDALKGTMTPWMKLPGVETERSQLIEDLKSSISEVNALQRELCLDAYHYNLYPDVRKNHQVTDPYLKNLATNIKCQDIPWKDESHVAIATYDTAYKKAKFSTEETLKHSLVVNQAGKESEAEKKLLKLTDTSTRNAESFAALKAIGPKMDSLEKHENKVTRVKKKVSEVAKYGGHFELFAEIVEVKEGNKFFKALGTILGASKDPLKDYLKGKYDPATKAAAAATAATEKETNTQAKFDLKVKLFEAEKQVELATIAIGNAKDATELATANANLRKAQLEVEEYQRRLALLP
ncbi:hypothetical protein [Pseudoalteromonas sp. NJ631]|uniref:hypothetical protein n=1 Tax=Pseudoalteromonas sp. NJ631 TaxID=493915 RepID=UPI000317B2D8|nr:hypothetical protein [Pseudoalteromonas sp. NJ631]